MPFLTGKSVTRFQLTRPGGPLSPATSGSRMSRSGLAGGNLPAAGARNILLLVGRQSAVITHVGAGRCGASGGRVFVISACESNLIPRNLDAQASDLITGWINLRLEALMSVQTASGKLAVARLTSRKEASQARPWTAAALFWESPHLYNCGHAASKFTDAVRISADPTKVVAEVQWSPTISHKHIAGLTLRVWPQLWRAAPTSTS